MEVPWWPIVSILFILWTDAKICSKVEASILPQYTNSRLNVESESEQIATESVINFGTSNELRRQPTQPQPHISQKDTLRRPFTTNPNIGLPISLKQSVAVQENVSQQQKQAFVSSKSTSANQQRSKENCNNLPRSNKVVFPVVVTTNNPPKQDNIVQQNSLVSSSLTATNQNLLSSQCSFKNPELASLPISNQVYLQEINPQEQLSCKSVTQYVPKNQFTQNLPISSLTSQTESSASSSITQSNSINTQNGFYPPEVASLQQISQQSNVVLTSSPQSIQSPVASNDIFKNNNRNSISYSAQQPFIKENILYQPDIVVSTAISDITAQSIPNTKSLNFNAPIDYRPTSYQASQQENDSQQKSSIKNTSQLTTIVQEPLSGYNRGLFPSASLLQGSIAPWYNMPRLQEPVYQPKCCSSLRQFPPVDTTSQTSTSQIDTVLRFPVSNTQNVINPQINQISTELNTVSANLLASPINTQKITTQQQPNIPVTYNANYIPTMTSNTVVSNNLELTSNIPSSIQDVSLISSLQSNFVNPNIGSLQKISSKSNSVVSDLISSNNAVPLITSNLKSPIENTAFSSNTLSGCFDNVPINSYSYPREINPYLGNLQYPVISQLATLPSISSLGTQPVLFTNVNPSLTNLPVSNFNTKCIKPPKATDLFPSQQSSFNTVNLIQQSAAVNKIASEGLYESEVNNISSITQSQPLLPESKIVLSNPDSSYSYQTSVQSDISSSSIAPTNKIQFNSQVDDIISKTSINPFDPATYDLSYSGLLTTEPATSVSSSISTTNEAILNSSNNELSTTSVNFNVNNGQSGLTSPTISILASAPTIPVSVTPVCSATPSPSVTSLFTYPPIQPIIMEGSNSKTKNWLPILLASIIRDNGFSGNSGGCCNNLCNCGTQYRQCSSQTPLYNNFNPCCCVTGGTCNRATQSQSNPLIIIEVDSDDTDNTESVKSNDSESDLTEIQDTSSKEPDKSAESSDENNKMGPTESENYTVDDTEVKTNDSAAELGNSDKETGASN